MVNHQQIFVLFKCHVLGVCVCDVDVGNLSSQVPTITLRHTGTFFSYQDVLAKKRQKKTFRENLTEKKSILSSIAQITSPPPPSPQFGKLVPLFSDVENYVFAGITGPSNDDYDNDGSDNCDHNFGTFDDFGVKNDQKVSNNMILMSKYKGKHGGKKGQKIRAWVDPPPHSGNARKKTFFFDGCLP